LTTFKQRPLVSLSFCSENQSYKENLSTLLSLIDQTPENALVVAHEVAITNFDYEHFEAAAAFADTITQTLLHHAPKRIIVITMIEKVGAQFFNFAKVFYQGQIIHTQAKSELFIFGGEGEYFSAGQPEAITTFEIDGIKMGLMICFELRFKQFWKQLEGAEIIIIPAQWGALRRDNFVILSSALAIMNQCYVIASDANNSDTTQMSGIITPFGVEERNQERELLVVEYKEKEVRKMRRYLNVGLQ